MKSEEFNICEGLRQGGVMSPTLFNIFMDDIIERECRPKLKKPQIGYCKLKGVCIMECAFADEVVVIAGKESDLQHNL